MLRPLLFTFLWDTAQGVRNAVAEMLLHQTQFCVGLAEVMDTVELKRIVESYQISICNVLFLILY